MRPQAETGCDLHLSDDNVYFYLYRHSISFSRLIFYIFNCGSKDNKSKYLALQSSSFIYFSVAKH